MFSFINTHDLVPFEKPNQLIYSIDLFAFGSNAIAIRERGKYTDLTFEMTRFHHRWTVIGIFICWHWCLLTLCASVGVGDADGCNVGESSYTPHGYW